MGYTGLNGASATSISALHKYGLLEKNGEDIKVSERAMRILHPQFPAERPDAIREAAHEPELFRELADRFPGKTPNDDLLKNYLVRNGFALGALTSVISAYRETSDMVEREAGGYIPEAQQPVEITMQSQLPVPSATIQASIKTQELQYDERQIGRYDFEGGAYVRISAFGEIGTAEALEMAQTIIDLKRKELERRKRSSILSTSMNNAENEDL